MKTKLRDHRKLKRAQNTFKKAITNGIGYGEGLLTIQLNVMAVARWFYTKYPKPLPKIKYKYETS